MLKVTNYGAACCVIESESGYRILCDPWLFGDIYYGTWEREHKLADPIAAIGRVDVIWISHLHEDHLHLESLRLLRKYHPEVPIWIGTHCKHLARMLGEFQPAICDAWPIDETASASTHPSLHAHSDGIDSFLVASDAHSAVVNFNDVPFHPEAAELVRNACGNRHLTALLPYTGAGPWPQCYDMPESDMRAAADAKRAKFLAQFAQYREALRPDVAIPFSAGYRLRGPLACLNDLRGIPSPHEVPGATVLPVAGVSPYVWELDPVPDDAAIHQALLAASMRAPKVGGEPLTVDINWGTSASYVDATYAPAQRAHETITVDARLLHGLLTRKYHWNTAEVGSCLRVKRHGEGYDSRVFSFLYRLHV